MKNTRLHKFDMRRYIDILDKLKGTYTYITLAHVHTHMNPLKKTDYDT